MKRKEVLYRPIYLNKENRKIIGENLILTNGKKWENRRRNIQKCLFNITNTAFVDKLFNKMLNDNIIPTINKCINDNSIWYQKK